MQQTRYTWNYTPTNQRNNPQTLVPQYTCMPNIPLSLVVIKFLEILWDLLWFYPWLIQSFSYIVSVGTGPFNGVCWGSWLELVLSTLCCKKRLDRRFFRGDRRYGTIKIPQRLNLSGTLIKQNATNQSIMHCLPLFMLFKYRCLCLMP